MDMYYWYFDMYNLIRSTIWETKAKFSEIIFYINDEVESYVYTPCILYQFFIFWPILIGPYQGYKNYLTMFSMSKGYQNSNWIKCFCLLKKTKQKNCNLENISQTKKWIQLFPEKGKQCNWFSKTFYKFS